MEDLMAGRSDAHCEDVLAKFMMAHQLGMASTGNTDHVLSVVTIEERRIVLLGKIQRFRDQGEALCTIANMLDLVDARRHEKRFFFQRALKVAEAHGFFSVECIASLGLGQLALDEGRNEEGLELLRHALTGSSPRLPQPLKPDPF